MLHFTRSNLTDPSLVQQMVSYPLQLCHTETTNRKKDIYEAFSQQTHDVHTKSNRCQTVFSGSTLQHVKVNPAPVGKEHFHNAEHLTPALP